MAEKTAAAVAAGAPAVPTKLHDFSLKVRCRPGAHPVLTVTPSVPAHHLC